MKEISDNQNKVINRFFDNLIKHQKKTLFKNNMYITLREISRGYRIMVIIY